ncbi:hypothetical protein CL3_03810 [butyrate-producing bacterium SM4/1]|nr:hypothetical protein CLOM621_06981 [Clostridium sp. M62/1]CBK75930.1 hypothetical protein CLS_00250 [[Clostridium] cf. saccharolyticum K10]CBL35618.1 hypothetical protein CL3_03810 [butyrate-producing bacterium SM4/1]
MISQMEEGRRFLTDRRRLRNMLQGDKLCCRKQRSGVSLNGRFI